MLVPQLGLSPPGHGQDCTAPTQLRCRALRQVVSRLLLSLFQQQIRKPSSCHRVLVPFQNRLLWTEAVAYTEDSKTTRGKPWTGRAGGAVGMGLAGSP